MGFSISGLIGAVVGAALAAHFERKQKPARRNAEGWKVLRVSGFALGAILGSAAFAALMGLFLWNGGSTRADAEKQNVFAVLLLIAMGGAALYLLWSAYGRTIMWQGGELRVRTVLGTDVVYRIADVSSIRRNEILGEYCLTFRDGSTLRLPIHFHGSKELIAKMPSKAHGS